MRTWIINYSESPVQCVCTVAEIEGEKIIKAYSSNINKTEGMDKGKFIHRSFKKAVKKEAI